MAEAAPATFPSSLRQAVFEMLRRVEDMRDDPAIDALIEKAGRLISGRAA